MSWATPSGATDPSWADSSVATVPGWYQLSAVTDTDATYPIGVDFQLKASEQFPMKVSTSRPLKIVESAYSVGLP